MSSNFPAVQHNNDQKDHERCGVASFFFFFLFSIIDDF